MNSNPTRRPPLSAAAGFTAVLLLAAPAARAMMTSAFVPAPTVPSIMQQPQATTIYQGQPLTLRVSIYAYPEASLQWLKDGANIPGATTRILAQPAHVAVAAGQAATLRVSASGETLSFQWRRNGVDLPGATQATFVVPAAIPTDMGFYSVIVRGASDPLESDVAILAVTAAGTSSRLVNCATRGFVPAGGSLTPGFVWRGPGLATFGVGDRLENPRLALHTSVVTAPIARNDDWANDASMTTALAVAGAFPLAAGSRDAALVVTLPPGAYTVAVSGLEGATGNALVEICDLDL
ncbi:MAG: immunoglobulin domain-containing protein [Verrucomicrobia bacterium]|nr:immunoglobulin domain-containing protein [Verrucomicrobiota bacterium]